MHNDIKAQQTTMQRKFVSF